MVQYKKCDNNDYEILDDNDNDEIIESSSNSINDPVNDLVNDSTNDYRVYKFRKSLSMTGFIILVILLVLVFGFLYWYFGSCK